jgi:hypothetical protein
MERADADSGADDSTLAADALGEAVKATAVLPSHQPRGQLPLPKELSTPKAAVSKAAVTKAHDEAHSDSAIVQAVALHPGVSVALAQAEDDTVFAHASFAAAEARTSACADVLLSPAVSRATLEPTQQAGAKPTRSADNKSAKKRAKRDPAAAVSGAQSQICGKGSVSKATFGDSLRFRSQLLQCPQERRTNQSDLDGWGDEW